MWFFLSLSMKCNFDHMALSFMSLSAGHIRNFACLVSQAPYFLLSLSWRLTIYLVLCCFMHQVRIHQFLKKTKKIKVDKDTKLEGDASSNALEEQVKLRKKVTDLMKKQKLHAVNQIVKKQDESKPWSQDARAKVKRFSELSAKMIVVLIYIACIKVLSILYFSGWEPSNWIADANCLYTASSWSIIRWSTWYSSRIYTHIKNCSEKCKVKKLFPFLFYWIYFRLVFNSLDYGFVLIRNTSRRYGVIECDPLILKGLERTVSKLISCFLLFCDLTCIGIP